MKETKSSTPVAWKSGNLSYDSRLTLATAKKMLEAGEKEAKKRGVPMSMAISDAGGSLVAFSRMDNAAMFSIQIAMDKAFTTVFGKMPTGSFASQYCAGGLVPLFFHERWITFPGGFPLMKNRVILGGIGVSGGTIEDVYEAKAALEVGGFQLDGVDAAIIAATGDAQKKRKR
jgi:glc operon protein GlcG